MDALRELFLDVVFGNGRIALSVIVLTAVVVALARLGRPVKF